MNPGLSNSELHTWRVFLSVNVRLLERLDHELQQRSFMSLTDYEILSVLAAAPERRLRMSDLAERVLVSRSRLTYRVDRLSRAHFVAREECEDDRRGLFAALTDTGQKALDDAIPGHIADLRNWFFDNIDADDLQAMSKVMSRVDGKLTTN